MTYDGLPDRLEALADRIHGHRACQTGWELGPTTATPTPAQRVAGGRLNVRRSRLLATPDEHRCIVISGGGTRGRLGISNVGEAILEQAGVGMKREHFERIDAEARESIPVWRHSELTHFLVVNARMDPWTDQGALLRPLDPSKPPMSEEEAHRYSRTMRDLRLVEAATQQVVECARDAGFRAIGSMLLRRAGVEPSRARLARCCR